jgi:membrane-bound ClpP family serine protease
MSELGIGLVVTGVVLLVAEAHLATAGVLGVVGTVSLALGGALVLAGAGAGAVLALPIALCLALVGVVSFAVAAPKVAAARRGRVRSGIEALVGHVGVVRGWAGSRGQVYVDGALWRAQEAMPEEPALHSGDAVRVEGVRGLTLSVRRAEEWELTA